MKDLLPNRTHACVQLLAAAALLVPTAASAQQVVWSSTGQTTGDDIHLVYSEVGYYFTDEGLSPFLALGGYGLWTPGSDSWQINPGVGLRAGFESGMVAGKVGYAFLEEDGLASNPYYGGTEDGVTTTAIAEYWGDGTFGLQGIASGNWASDFVWTRGRATVGVSEMDSGSLHLGGDLVWQADLDDRPLVDEFESYEYGPVLQWRGNGGLQLTAGGGWKKDELSDDSYYLRLGLVIVR